MNDPTQQARQQNPAHHPVVISHLVVGVALLGLLSVWALVVAGVVEGAEIRFLLPAPWVLAGVAGLVALIASDRRRHARRETGWVDTQPPVPSSPPLAPPLTAPLAPPVAPPSAPPVATTSARLDE